MEKVLVQSGWMTCSVKALRAHFLIAASAAGLLLTAHIKRTDAGVVCEAGKNITINRQVTVDNSLGWSDDLGLLFDRGDGCDFSINVRDLSEEAELVFCVHCLILMIYPELNLTNESRNLSVDVSQTCHPHVSAFLLNHIRFLLISVDELYEIQFSSSTLHQNHEKLYLTGLLKGFQFNALPFSKIRNKMDNMSNEYLPRIYTGDEWSVFVNDTTVNHPHYDYDDDENNRLQTFSTPAHTSALYRKQKVQWRAQVFLSAQECSDHDISCRSFPVARFLADDYQNRYASSIRFSNRLILSCKKEKNIFHVQDFKKDMAVIPANSSMGLPNPCPDDYCFRFVVRPEFI